MTSDFGILAYGAYVPRRRLQRSAIHAANRWFSPGIRGKGEKAISNWDEDTLTMAVEAGRDCLTGLDRQNVAALRIGSTTFPNADRSNAGIVKEALTLSDEIAVSDISGSQRAATSGLLQVLDGNGPTQTLVIGSERRLARVASPGEMAYGDGAAAVLIGKGNVVARCIAKRSVTRDFVDHFRASDAKFDFDWESRWIRDEGYFGLVQDAITQTITENGVAPESLNKIAIAITARGVASKLAKQCSLNPDNCVNDLSQTVGNSGAAHPMMILVSALESASPGDRILLVSFGQGVDVMIFEVTDAIKKQPKRIGLSGWLSERTEDTNYNRYLFHRGLLDVDKGMRAEMDHKQPGSTLYRQRKSVLGLVGGRCTKTGTIQFPKTDISVNPNDRTQNTQDDYPLAELQANLATFTADSLTYTPDPPGYYGMINFEGGGRMMADFTDISNGELAVGDPMRMVFRIKAQDEARGFTKYFWKAAPAPKAWVPEKGES